MKTSSAYSRRMTEFVEYHIHNFVGFAAHHIGYQKNKETEEEERLYECSLCGEQFPESKGQAELCDNR